MNGRIANEFRYLGEIVVIFPDKLLCKFDFQVGEIINNAAVRLFPKKLLKLRTSD